MFGFLLIVRIRHFTQYRSVPLVEKLFDEEMSLALAGREIDKRLASGSDTFFVHHQSSCRVKKP